MEMREPVLLVQLDVRGRVHAHVVAAGAFAPHPQRHLLRQRARRHEASGLEAETLGDLGLEALDHLPATVEVVSHVVLAAPLGRAHEQRRDVPLAVGLDDAALAPERGAFVVHPMAIPREPGTPGRSRYSGAA